MTKDDTLWSKRGQFHKRREPQEPTVEDSSRGVVTETVESHPAYAQIGASRVSGGAFLYGSDFRHQHYITITIHDSALHRSLSGDRAHGGKRLIEVALSEAQWATFVSSLNQGDGVQCTLEYTPEAGLIPAIAQPKDRKLQFSQEMAERFEIANKALRDVGTLVEISPLSQKKKDEIMRELTAARMNIGQNTDYVTDRFDEHMERTVEKAKSEVNAYAQHTLGDLAQMALRGGGGDEPFLLEAPDETDGTEGA